MSKTNASTAMSALTMSTLGFTLCFAMWTLFSILGVRIKDDLGLNSTEFGILIATPILTGSLIRIFLGVFTDQYGGRVIYTMVMLFSAASAWFLTYATTYSEFLVGALGVGVAGGSFAVGVAYVSRFFGTSRQGTALGIFGMGNVGSALTAFAAPIILNAHGWQAVCKTYAVVMAGFALIFWLTTSDEPSLLLRRERKEDRPGFFELLKPLRNIQVWRFSLYYFFVFGAFVALALWLPKYYMSVYSLDIKTAGLMTAVFAAPGSLFRALGGWLSDLYGARKVMYWTFLGSTACILPLCIPKGQLVLNAITGDITLSIGVPLWFFVSLTAILGFFMSLGKAAVYKHIPHYYPNHVGAVGGIVGLMGGLGGFILPIVYGALNDKIGVWASCFMVLFVIVVWSLIWMHLAIRRMEKNQHPELRQPKFLPEYYPKPV